MSFQDDLKVGYSYRTSRAVALSTPVLAPSDSVPAGSGVIPDGAVSFRVSDGNWISTVKLPPATANSKVVTIKRDSSWGFALAIDNTSLDKPIDFGGGDWIRMRPIPSTGLWEPLMPSIETPIVTNQTTVPTASSPAGALTGDAVRVSTAGGLNLSFRNDGAGWVAAGVMQQPPAPPSINEVTYYGPSTYINYGWTSLGTVNTVVTAANGFSAVGGAANAGVGTFANAFVGRNIARAYAPVVVNSVAPADTAQFTAPTAYFLHDIAITAGKDNTYHFLALNDRKIVLDVWICTYATGAPAKKLGSMSNYSTGSALCLYPNVSPENYYSGASSNMGWLSTNIPKSVIATYASGGKVKLALVPAQNTGDTINMYFNGTAMTETRKWYHFLSGYYLEGLPCGGGSAATIGTGSQGVVPVTIAASGNISKVRIPLVDTATDVIVSMIGYNSGGGPTVSWIKGTLEHSSGNVDLGRPKPTNRAPIVDSTMIHAGTGFVNMGWRIPAATLAAKSVTPTNSAIPYLEITLTNGCEMDPVSLCGIVVERA